MRSLTPLSSRLVTPVQIGPLAYANWLPHFAPVHITKKNTPFFSNAMLKSPGSHLPVHEWEAGTALAQAVIQIHRGHSAGTGVNNPEHRPCLSHLANERKNRNVIRSSHVFSAK